MDENALRDLAGALDGILDSAGAGKVVAACNRLTTALEAISSFPSPVLPHGVRPDIHRVAAVLTSQVWEEVLRWGTTFNIDLRDLNEKELAYLERVSLKLVQRWRREGTGPTYRNEAGIRYSLKDLWEWRRKGRQTMTALRARRGRKRADDLV
jgi:hypothetical protein